jgi:hypothetical protein
MDPNKVDGSVCLSAGELGKVGPVWACNCVCVGEEKSLLIDVVFKTKIYLSLHFLTLKDFSVSHSKGSRS